MAEEYTRRSTVLGILPIAGQLIFADNFEGLLQWRETGFGGDTIFELDPTVAFTGNQSLYMKTRLTGPAAGQTVTADRNLYFHPSKLLTFSSHFLMPDPTLIERVLFSLLWYDGVTRHRAQVVYFPNTPKWTFLDSAGDATDISGFDVELNLLAWHEVTLKVDFLNDRYLFLQADHLFADLPAQALEPFIQATPTYIQASISIATIGAAPCDLNIDNIALHEL